MSGEQGEQLPKFLGENDIVPNASFISSNDAEEEDTVEDMQVGNLNSEKEAPSKTTVSSGSQPSTNMGRSIGTASRKGKRKAPAVSNATEATDDGGSKNTELRLVSPIWDHYKVQKIDGIRVAHCKYCGVDVPAHGVRNTTSSARNHYLKCKMNPANIRTDQTYLNFPKAGSAEVTGSHKWQFDCKKLWDTIVDKFIVDGTPFTEIEKPGFKKMAKVGFHPSFTLPGRTKLARDCMERHDTLRASIKNFFSTKKQRVSLTSDCWTSSNQNTNYLSLTAHFIDDNFKLQKKVLSFVTIDSHTGVDLAYVIEGCLRDWAIDKVFCITLDNATCNDVMVRTLRETVNEWGGSLLGGLYTKMKKFIFDSDTCIKTMANRMISKFDKYWGDPEKLNMVICFALVLDPRCKIEFLTFTLCNLYGPIRGKLNVETVKSEMSRLYNAYVNLHPSVSSSTSVSASHVVAAQTVASMPASSSSSVQDDMCMTVEEFNLRRMTASGSNSGKQKTELDKYLGEDVDPYSEKFEVLLWWKVNSARFPILTQMAKDVLAVPISTVASESAFSTSGRVLSDFRSALKPQSVEALVCAQDWLYPRGGPEPPTEEDVLDFLAELDEEPQDDVGSLN